MRLERTIDVKCSLWDSQSLNVSDNVFQTSPVNDLSDWTWQSYPLLTDRNHLDVILSEENAFTSKYMSSVCHDALLFFSLLTSSLSSKTSGHIFLCPRQGNPHKNTIKKYTYFDKCQQQQIWEGKIIRNTRIIKKKKICEDLYVSFFSFNTSISACVCVRASLYL